LKPTRSAQGRISRRNLLCSLGAGLATPFLIRPALAGIEVPATGGRLDGLLSTIEPHLDVVNANTGEHLATDFVNGGGYDERALNRLDWLFRDWRQDQGTVIDRRVYWGLAAVAHFARQRGASGRITLISGFRSPATTQLLRSSGGASSSFHMRGQAADIQVDGMPAEEVTGYARWLQMGGVGHYPGEGFTHIDSGPVRVWQG
jgi:uncharacterized protein YcbK (DUF882 family)